MRVPRERQGGQREVPGDPAGRRDAQGLRAARLRPARRGAARRRPGGEGQPRTCASSSTTRATTRATSRRPTAATTRPTRAPPRSTASSSRCARTTTTRPRFRKKGKTFGNVPNVYAELGSVWRDTMSDPDAGRAPARQADQPRRARSGSRGAPTASGTARRSRRSSRCAGSSSPTKGKELYGLPYGLDGDVEDPTRPAPEPGADDPQRDPRPQRREAVQHRPGQEAARDRAATRSTRCARTSTRSRAPTTT